VSLESEGLGLEERSRDSFYLGSMSPCAGVLRFFVSLTLSN
jgi:hypothetical protein